MEGVDKLEVSRQGKIRLKNHAPKLETNRSPRDRAAVLGFSIGLAVLCVLAGCGTTAADRARTEAVTRAGRLGHPEIEYREVWSPGTAIFLGLVPFGAGGLYVRDRWLAGSGLLWPFSMAWVPRMAYGQAIELNDSDFEFRMMQALEQRSEPTPAEPAEEP